MGLPVAWQYRLRHHDESDVGTLVLICAENAHGKIKQLTAVLVG